MPIALDSCVLRGLVQPLIPLQKMFNFTLKHRDPFPSHWSEEMRGRSWQGFWHGWFSVSWVVGSFGFRVSQVSTTGPMESCSGRSRGHELSGAGGRGEWATPAAALQLTQPCETKKKYIWTCAKLSKKINTFVGCSCDLKSPPVCRSPVG